MMALVFLIFSGLIHFQGGKASVEISDSHEDVPDEYSSHTIERSSGVKGFISSLSQEVASSTPVDARVYCNSFQTCYECVKSMYYACNWCHTLGCIDIEENLCATTSKSDHKVCPYIKNQGPILIPSGQRSHIAVKLHVSDPVIYDMAIICQVKFKNRLTHLKGLILKDTVYCYPMKLDVGEYRDAVSGSFRLIWGGVDPFSNELPVTVYSCGVLADECESCRLIGAEFGCGWCDESSSCVVANKCNDIMNWSLNRVTCQFNKKKMFFV